jgi:iron complex transport system substrate-binding protein
MDAIWISGHGDSLPPGSLGSQWLRLAGFDQRPLPGGRATLEGLLTNPPKVLIRSNYRSGEVSGGTEWLNHPIVRRAGARQITTDGRPWTCQGPLMIPEIERLRKLAR